MSAQLQAVPGYQPSKADVERETKMHRLLQMYDRSDSPIKKRWLWDRYRVLHEQRPEQYVLWMERNKGVMRGRVFEG